MLGRAGRSRAQVTKTETFPAPSRGWVQSGNIVTASLDQAEVLDNFIPTAQGARMRGGALEHADIGAAVVRMFSYSSGGVEDFFAGTAADIYDVDRVVENGGVVSRGVDGHTLTTGADWTAGFLNSGTKGAFLSSTDTASLVGTVLSNDFASGTTGWTFEGTATDTSTAGFLSGTTGGATNLLAHRTITTVIGKEYVIDIVTGAVPASTAVYAGDAPASIALGSTGFSSSGTGTLTFTATGTTTFLSVMSVGGSSPASLDSVIVTLLDEDRSVNANPLTVNGTITRTAVATGAELVAYSGFSVSNYLEGTDASYVDTLYAMGWEQTAGVWEFKHGVVSAAPIDGLTIVATTLKIEGTKPKALIRLTSTTPTSAQINEIQEKESVLFAENSELDDLAVSNDFSDVEGLTSGDWTFGQIATAGGQFMICANGSDYVHYWDGTNWNPITDEAIFDLSFDDERASFAVGQTITGGTSGATAEIHGITKTSNTAGTLRLGAITGTFQDDETITDGLTGSATANGVSSAGSTVAITGVDTSTLSQVWNFKERLFFVEEDTANVWYLPTESIGGAATEFPLGSVFALGGSVLFGATWSLDSGSGLDDVCLFVSSEGEIAVYEGSNPNSVTTWSLVGVYKIGKPLNKHGFFAAGGDLAILTEDGIIPVSEALKKDRAALQAVAISYPIEDAWKSAIANRTVEYPISVTLWQSQTLLLVGTPAKVGGRNVSFAANARTGAWGRVTGWDVRCSHVVGDQLYFANEVGKIFEADNGGQDDGASYTAVYVGKFSPSDEVRAANTVGITYRCTSDVNLILDAMADYNVENIETPAPIAEGDFSTWGTGVWGNFVWGDTGSLSTFTTWQSSYAVGYSLAPAVAMTSNQTGKPTVEILMTRVRSERGYAM